MSYQLFQMLFHLRKFQTDVVTSQTFCGSAKYCNVFMWQVSHFRKSFAIKTKCKTEKEMPTKEKGKMGSNPLYHRASSDYRVARPLCAGLSLTSRERQGGQGVHAVHRPDGALSRIRGSPSQIRARLPCPARSHSP